MTTNKKKKKPTQGGKAEAAGGDYEVMVGAWYCHCVLMGTTLEPLLDLPPDVEINAVDCQSSAPVDDVNAHTSDGGIVFVQAKRSVALSDQPVSSFAKALDQFVRQYKACNERSVDEPWARLLDLARDRLVLATSIRSSSKVREKLGHLLARVRLSSGTRSLKQVVTSDEERKVAEVTEKNLKRSWKSAYGKQPTAAELGALLRFIWIQTLNLEPSQNDRAALLTMFRLNLLEDKAQSRSALSKLYELVGTLRAQRASVDKAALLDALTNANIRLLAHPNYRQDIRALKDWTSNELKKAPRYTRLLDAQPTTTIERGAWPSFLAAAKTESLLVVGDPGAGKSGLMYRLGQIGIMSGDDVIFIPVDALAAETRSALQTELGIMHKLADILASWPGERRAFLIIDALDAARKPETQKVLTDLVDEVLRLAGTRWRVIASVRKYDLRQGTEWARMFRGTPPAPNYIDPEFKSVQHVAIGSLTDPEVEQIATVLPKLHTLFVGASAKLRGLLRNIFNLRLLAELLDAGVAPAALSAIRTQPELLDRYWVQRVRRNDGKHDAREMALTSVVDQMIMDGSLRARRDKVRNKVDASALVDLEKVDVLRAELRGGVANEDVLLFSHHVLFDYAAARLKMKRGHEPQELVALLKSQRELTLMLGPSLTMSLIDVWSEDGRRDRFWELAIALAREPDLTGAARLSAPMVATELMTNVDDLAPLYSMLATDGSSKSGAESFARHLVTALFVQNKAGIPLIGPNAGPWMEVAEKMAGTANAEIMGAVRALIGVATDKL